MDDAIERALNFVEFAEKPCIHRRALRVEIAGPDGFGAVPQKEGEFLCYRLVGVRNHGIDRREGRARVVAKGDDALAQERGRRDADSREIQEGGLRLRRGRCSRDELPCRPGAGGASCGVGGSEVLTSGPGLSRLPSRLQLFLYYREHDPRPVFFRNRHYEPVLGP
jgi:hypothetical protein